MRQWHGSTVCPLLFDGQYADGESGWAYNRFRYYSPDLGVYGAQDPLGLSPNLGWAQGYVAHPGHMVDLLALMTHIKANNAIGKEAEQKAGEVIQKAMQGTDGRLAEQVRVGKNLGSAKGTYSNADFVIANGESMHIIEVKTGNAVLTANQEMVQKMANSGQDVTLLSGSRARTLELSKGASYNTTYSVFHVDPSNEASFAALKDHVSSIFN